MNFKVVFARRRDETSTKKYKGTDTYEILPGGVLRVEVQRPPERGVHLFAPGHWLEVAEGNDPITPGLEPDG